jgi:hypothetical protein
MTLHFCWLSTERTSTEAHTRVTTVYQRDPSFDGTVARHDLGLAATISTRPTE